LAKCDETKYISEAIYVYYGFHNSYGIVVDTVFTLEFKPAVHWENDWTRKFSAFTLFCDQLARSAMLLVAMIQLMKMKLRQDQRLFNTSTITLQGTHNYLEILLSSLYKG